MSYECKLDAKTVKKAENELFETKEKREECLKELREKLKKNTQLVCPIDEDRFLLKFLRARKFNTERAEELIIKYYTIRGSNPKFCSKVYPSMMEDIIVKNMACVLPGRTEDGCAVYIFRPGKWDPAVHDISCLFKMHLLSLEWIIESFEDIQVHGVKIVGDLSDMGWNHVKNFSREYAGLVTSLFQDGFPARVKGMNIVNEPSFFGYLFAIVKPFMKSKFLSRMHFHAYDLHSLHNSIPKSILPEHLGGDAGDWDDLCADFCTKLKSSESYFQDLSKYKLHGITAVGDSSSSGKEVGDGTASVTGTFKKLNVE
ncbi:DgyrCDS14660 [Dimorphilus gyrociliatus]|uniref:DgyrCDS14660 n=1 Tax=Dimorphilus gyrociliatus TaxID=2664684 RepID=A0A7I8WEN1_9ANNE|nr:DgyrCDS14660 [Dimorphilus gyrociliatus]